MMNEKYIFIVLLLVTLMSIECSCQFFTKTQKSIPRMGRSIDEVSFCSKKEKKTFFIPLN